MSRRLAIMALCILAAATCVWFSTRTSVEGVYVFRSPEVEETLELNPGGEFSQRIKMGNEVYHATGRWALKSRDLKFRNDFLVRFDIFKGKVLKPPLEVSLCSAYWDSWHNRISFSEDYDALYFVKRAQ